MDVRYVAKQLAKLGREGDDRLMHVSQRELETLKKSGKVTTNPETGLPEGYNLGHRISHIAHDDLGLTNNLGHDIAQAAKSGQDPLNPSSTKKRSGIAELAKHPWKMRVDKVMAQDKGTPIDYANLGALADNSSARNLGRAAGLIAGSWGAGVGASALGAGATGVTGASGATAMGEGAAMPSADIPVDQGAVNNAGIGGDLPQQLSGPITDSSDATNASFGGGGDTFVPPADLGSLPSDVSSGGFDTPSGMAQGSGGGGGEAGGPRVEDTSMSWGDIGAKALKYGPLALGGASAIAQKVAYNRAAAHINAIGGPQRELGNQLIAQFNSGQINAADQAAIDRWQATASAQSKQYFANSGQSSSTAALQSQRDIGAQANAMKAQALQNMLTQGTSLLAMSDRYQLAAAQAELQGDAALAGSLGSFMGSYAKFLSATE